MKVGASQYHPGLTVRWVRASDTLCALYSSRERRCLALVEGPAQSGYAALIRADRSASLVDEPHTRRCAAKRAAEVLVGQWWREKCEREVLRKRYMVAMKDNGECLFDRMAKAACAAWADVSAAKGDDLDRLAALYGVERKATAPVRYTFRAEGAEKVVAGFRAMADAAREGAESVKGCYDVLSVLENEDTLRERMNTAYTEGRDLPVAEAFRGLPLVVTTIRECGPESGE